MLAASFSLILFSFLCIFRPYFRQAKRVIFNVYFAHDFQTLFSCHLSRKKWAFSWCQNRTLFRTNDFLSLILFYSDWYRLVFGPSVKTYNLIFTFRISRNVTLYIRTDFVEVCLYVEKKTAFSWRNNQWIVLAVDFQKDSFERSLPFLFFIVAVLRPIFAQTLTASMVCFFLLGPKIIDTTVNYFSEDQEDVTIHCTPKFRLKKQGMSLHFLDENRHRFVG